MRIYLETLGCRLNYSEMETLGRELVDVGHYVVPSPEEADICVLNTCAVTGEAARKSRQLARKLARSNPDARLAVTGCYATLEPETVAALPNVSLVVENRRKEQLAELLQPWSAELNGQQWLRLEPEAPAQSSHRTRAFVKVQDGCNNHCTFCIVTVARGEERSRRVADIVDEVRQLAAGGYQEAVLTGVHLGGYGSDLDSNLYELVGTILRHTDLPRLRLSSLEPWDLKPEFFDLWRASDGRLCPHLHLPLQAGCDRTLRRMARRTRTDDFRALVAAARDRIPDLVLTTDMIVGFPGESESDFQESLHFAEEMAFAHVHVFPYSARAGTAAASFSGQVPVETRRQRAAAMEAMARRTGDAVRQSFVGSLRQVLWESCEQPANGHGAVWTGLTDNYLRVRAVAPSGIDLDNRITATRLLGVSGDCLDGEVLSA
ncbi:MAG: tRNA (N(6)-L-threonylcarbamoyladenosine(37)-C(2))-methylthiotransferase MtaB [Anaerolineae bacterium]|nr:tRNA (N(6)-L-threonylcarbamoyladenosine(37)-C(2))-methylthiotransferase MtaB [Anaerolineae bacterium]